MFVLVVLRDTLKIIPADFRKTREVAIKDAINAKYSNRVLHDVGLCMLVHDLVEIDEGFVQHSEGWIWIKVQFRMIVFRPFRDEVLVGRVRSAGDEGIDVSMGFFEDIRIPASEMPSGSTYSREEGVWVWRYEENELFMDLNEPIRFRVQEINFLDISPPRPKVGDADSVPVAHGPPFSLVCTIAEEGQLGAFARDLLTKPSEVRPLGKIALGTAKVAHMLESATTGVRAQLPGPQHQAVDQLKRPIVASTVQSKELESTLNVSSSSWSSALDKASQIVGDQGTKKLTDPKEMVGSELSFITDNLARLLESGHPMLNTVSRYYFSASGKHIRPLLVMLVAQATSIATKREGKTSMLVNSNIEQIDYSLMDKTVSQNIHSDGESQRVNQLMEDATRNGHGGRPYSPHIKDGLTILPTHRRLAEITELIHTSSLLHDDVIDHAETRRGLPAIQKRFGNKMAIFAGDFLLARASMALARLRDPEVIEIMASVLCDLVDGEFKQLRNLKDEDAPMARPDESAFSYYLEKTYLKTGSLIAKSCRSSAILNNTTDDIVEAAYIYGRNLGIAFQLIDDLLDFTVSSTTFGKPVGADLELGLATAPVLYAWQEYPQLGPLVARKFSNDGDVAQAWELVHASKGLERTKALAWRYASRAIEALAIFPDSSAKEALQNVTLSVLTRSK
ncbi:coq1 putative hexaprenyl diphosphate synthase [Coemansia sp. RSA 990]|nr:coq1 putative hexaprenyl diphosphate synthase [Coemansia sp. RSA 990]